MSVPTKANALREQGVCGKARNSKANTTELSVATQSVIAIIQQKLADLSEAVTDQLMFIQLDHQGNAASIQRERVLAGLRISPLTTLDCRKHLDVLHPAMRVLELREEGYDIVTIHAQETISGKRHSVAKYVLMKEAGHE